MHRLLGNILEIVQRNVTSIENYEIDSLLLHQINKLDLDAKNIFWHDIAMSYLRMNNKKYIEYLEKVDKNNDSSYAKAQHILGHNCLLNGELKKAYQYLNQVNDVDREIYLNALIDLALVEEKLGNTENTLELYKKVIKFSNVNDLEYVKAQQNLASLYVDKKQYTQAEKCLKKISKSNTAHYADAQFSLGLISSLRGKDREALDFYSNVDNNYSRAYSKAKFNEGNIYYRSEDFALAKMAYDEVLVTEVDLYAKAQFSLGNIFLKENNIHEASERWKNIPENAEFYPQHGYLIQNTIEVERTAKAKNEFLNVIAIVGLILDSLHIKSKYENFIAHYTNLTVSKILLSTTKNMY